ncbi:MAG: helix-turn-helix domain-containing protein [Clostridiales bacterium]|nr:helix-turn-helix domain-containing protein [Clostridiales bacterium]
MFHERLQMLREEYGMMQKEVAERIGVSERVYSFYETGRFPKNEEILKKLAACFGCTTDYLLGVSEFRNYDELKKIGESLELLNQIEDPIVLENMKSILSALGDIGRSAQDKNYAVTSCLHTVTDSIHDIFSSYRASVQAAADTGPGELQNLKFFEFKTLSAEKIDLVTDSIKSMANEFADKIKVDL